MRSHFLIYTNLYLCIQDPHKFLKLVVYNRIISLKALNEQLTIPNPQKRGIYYDQ